MTYQQLAFFMGLFGSIHCAVMCGPLLFAVQGRDALSWATMLNKLLYQVGRIGMYSLLGFFLGIFGNIAQLKGGQQWLSLITGLFLLLMGLSMILGKRSKMLTSIQTKTIQPFVTLLSKYLYKPGGSFFAGILNGILPCGMVYMALASALNAEGIGQSVKFMLWFGVGTLPLMLLFSILSGFAKQVLKVRFNKIIPLFYFVMGCWFLLRGANLDIPYLSPMLYIDGASYCN